MATNIADGVWWFDLGMVNAYLVDDGAVTLVDAGTPGRADDLRDELDEAGYDPGAVDRVLITHFDVDHVGGLDSLGLDAPIHAMEPDASQLDGSLSAPLTNKKGLFQRLAGFVLTLPDAPVRRLDDGERIGGFRAYHTPGHTPGHTVFHHPDCDLALLGDLVAEDDGELDTPPWPLAYNNAENGRSIRELADRDLPFEIACMGHGDPLSSGGSRALEDLARRL